MVICNQNQLKNLAIYPSDFTTSISDGSILYWSNVNFEIKGN